MGELEWFLGIHVLRNRKKRELYLSQREYINKIARIFCTEEQLAGKLPTVPLIADLPPFKMRQVPPEEILLFLRMLGSSLFAGITTRPDIAFAVSKLAAHSQNPGPAQQLAATRLILYLYGTRDYGLTFGGQDPSAPDMSDSSDASYGYNKQDRKSSDGFSLRLFGGPVSWRAKKQQTVTTSSTEAELLALSRAAKESLFLSRMMTSIGLRFSDLLLIKCDNTNTLRLVKEDTVTLQTALRHVDIHNHWLRQEYREKRVDFQWVATAEMEADCLTKCLSAEKHRRAQELIHVTDLGAILPPVPRGADGRELGQAVWEDDFQDLKEVFEEIRI